MQNYTPHLAKDALTETHNEEAGLCIHMEKVGVYLRMVWIYVASGC